MRILEELGTRNKEWVNRVFNDIKKRERKKEQNNTTQEQSVMTHDGRILDRSSKVTWQLHLTSCNCELTVLAIS